jgi:hypothetical protein
VKTLFSSELLGTKGVFHWDGINEQQQKAPIGIYFCSFEAFQLNGTKKFAKRIALTLAGKIN